MKILQLVNRIPYPLNDGGNLAVHFYTEGFLKAGVQLSMLAMNTTRHWVNESELPPIFKQLSYFETVKVDNRIKPAAAFLNLFSHQSYNIERFISKNFKQTLIKVLSGVDFDIIQLEGLYLAPYISIIRENSKACIVLRQHNAEFLIWERLANQEPNFLKKQYLKLLTKRLKSFERKVLNEVDFLLAISKADAEIFKSLGANKPLFVQSFGLDISKIPFVPAFRESISIYHLGAMDWLPNQEAIRFFIRQVMPLVTAVHPDIKFHIAGRKMPEDFLQFQSKNIIIHGEVPDADEFEKDKSILVVPLLSGGGVRIKIFRAMAMGKAVVATSVGLEGIEIINETEAFIADTAQEMAAKIISLIQHPAKIEAMGNAARSYMAQYHDQQKMIGALLDKYDEIIKHQAPTK